MPKANIVYWYGLEGMPRDGGGLRALAWYEALSQLGMETKICPLRSPIQTAQGDSLLRRAKKRLIPMPLKSSLPEMRDADVTVVTVPAVFDSAASTLDSDSLIFDWMDLWSVNSRTMGRSSLLSRPGGLLQSVYWAARERQLVRRPAVNVYAGYEDKLASSADGSAPGFWVPTPITAVRSDKPKNESARLRVGFIANFAYPPNIMSLRDFFKEYGESFASREIDVVVAGFGSETVRTWGVDATVLGRVDSLSDFYRDIDAALVPIDHGGGIKAKAVEAMAHGVPVFGTRHVASGFSPEWAPYIGDIHELLKGQSSFPPVPTVRDFDQQFSQAAFNETVRTILSQMGNMKLTV